MSYQVLARKWRPKAFAELVGQSHVVQALSSALTRGRLHHAYLLTGTRGVGKTTIARILAKSLNCLTNGVTAEPCGTCEACADIDAGRFPDLLELDAASNTGIDNMREILDNARYAPTVGRYKVYLIDEVHMLSKAAFNSMLKTLEEPPEHVKFVLATTDPQKIPITVLSRCLQFNLKQLPPSQIEERLAAILEAEAIGSDRSALHLIARGAQGSMRDALSLLDQAIAYGSGEVRDAAVREMLGAVDTGHVYRITDALLDGNGQALLAEADAIASRSISPASALDELATIFHRIATAQVVPAATEAMDDGDRVSAYARKFAPELVQVNYQICVQGRADLALAPDEATGFSMTLLRLLAFVPGDVAVGSGSTRQEARGAANAAGRAQPSVAPRAQPSAPPRAQLAGASTVQPRVATTVPGESVSRRATTSPEGADADQAALPQASREGELLVPVTMPEDATDAPVTSALAPDVQVARAIPTESADWPAFVVALKLIGVAGQLAAQSEFVRCTGRDLVLAVPESQKHLVERAYVEKLKAAIEDAAGAKLRVTVELSSSGEASLAAQARREKAEQKAQAESAFRNEPFVREAITRFDARVKPDSIKRVP